MNLPACSFWLVPEPTVFARLSRKIADLAREHGAQPFAPHLTVASRPLEDEAGLISLADRAALREPIELTATGLDWRDDFFRTLFIGVGPDERLLDLRGFLLKEAAIHPWEPFFPHVSLLYKGLSPAKKKALAVREYQDFGRLRFTELWLVSPQNVRLGWRDPASWRVLRRAALSVQV